MPLTTKEFCALAGVSDQTVRGWVRLYGVHNKRRGWWTVREIRALEAAAAAATKKLRKRMKR